MAEGIIYPAHKMTGFLPPLVVKAGGSLSDMIPDLAQVFFASGRDLLIVPGGGQFADAVRATGISGTPAHWMAVAAMEQTGWMWVDEGAAPYEELTAPKGVCVLLPLQVMKELDPLPHRWDITSDTIAAFVAATLGSPLLILKSVDGIRIKGVVQEMVSSPVDSGELDPCCLPLLFSRKVPGFVINGRKLPLVAAALAGENVPGTRIQPSL